MCSHSNTDVQLGYECALCGAAREGRWNLSHDVGQVREIFQHTFVLLGGAGASLAGVTGSELWCLGEAIVWSQLGENAGVSPGHTSQLHGPPSQDHDMEERPQKRAHWSWSPCCLLHVEL